MHPLLRFTLDLFEPNPAPAQVEKAPVAIKNVVEFRHPKASRELRLGGALVAYQFQRGQRRSIGFSVGADGLAVRAPKWVTLVQVDAAVQAKAPWILRKLQETRERHARLAEHVIDWRDGARLPYLGQALTIRLEPGHRFGAGGAELLPAGDPADEVAPTAVLRLSLPHGASPEQIRDRVQAWLMRQARTLFQQRLDHYAPMLGVQWRKLALSNAGTRWGSASVDGSIRLNWRLVHFRMSVLDYVVVHELSHLRVMDHSPRFWDTVRSVVPDYAALRQQLKSEVAPRWDL
ncbi:SprT family zinc-dependent metalloprotease [Rhodoferax sp.]|uniref:M48 family metallopeptidase n=1 Tax=Rhodoferax sp. TaxID=50421 RepID=UPI002614AAA9|nr:SprT family zinc-dependent metalloprotease [Rhodoferax sp.]MDD2926058.1 SprT family zinc-dependent metalloprotease [Rhodoferax sp.]